MKKILALCILSLQLLLFQAHAESVICIHGLLNNARSMNTIKNVLISEGCEVVLWEYQSRQRFIEEHACDLVAYLQQLACQCPGKPIHFVTHSIGALIVRAALNTPSCPLEAKIGRAVLIAPPNQGSYLARRFQNVFLISAAMGEKSGWQLMHYKPCDVAGFGEFPKTMQVLVIAGTQGNTIWFSGPNDGYLALEETRLNTPSYFVTIPATHGDLLTKRAALRCIRQFITSP